MPTLRYMMRKLPEAALSPLLTGAAREGFSTTGVNTELRRAFSEKEFVLYYQPQLRISDGSLVGAEALLRWQHPARGIIGLERSSKLLRKRCRSRLEGDSANSMRNCRNVARHAFFPSDWRQSVSGPVS